MKSSTYQRILRISTVVMAFVLLFQSGLVDDRTTGLFSETTDYLAANVGMSVSVAPTEFNAITAELTKQQTLLAQREQAVAEREIAVTLNSGSSNSDTSEYTTYFLAVILFIQLVLIVLNYGLDFLRSRELHGLTGPQYTRE